MKKFHILMAVALMSLALLLAACSNTSAPVSPSTSPDLGTQKNVSNASTITPPPQQNTSAQPAQQPQTTTSAPPSTPKVSVVSVEAFGTTFGSRHYFNRLLINVSPQPDYSKIALSIMNPYFNSTLMYNQSVNCSDITSILATRNTQYGVTADGFCFAPPRDLIPSDTMVVTATSGSDTVFIQNVAIPHSVSNTYVRLQ